MADEDLWRRRFFVFMLTRLLGVATFFLGIAIIYTDLLRQGGWPAALKQLPTEWESFRLIAG